MKGLETREHGFGGCGVRSEGQTVRTFKSAVFMDSNTRTFRCCKHKIMSAGKECSLDIGGDTVRWAEAGSGRVEHSQGCNMKPDRDEHS
jgi:hypothetical protein